MTRIDVPVNPRGGPRDAWASPCGHEVPKDVLDEVWLDGSVPVHIEAVTGVALIAAERKRQRDEEGHSVEDDAAQDPSRLLWLTWCYVDAAASGKWDAAEPPAMWPDKPEDWKPGPTNIRNAVKAGASLASWADAQLARGEQP
jgi:hypothetical protein